MIKKVIMRSSIFIIMKVFFCEIIWKLLHRDCAEISWNNYAFSQVHICV